MQALGYYLNYARGLMEELGRHRGGGNDQSCKICGSECESVEHYLGVYII